MNHSLARWLPGLLLVAGLWAIAGPVEAGDKPTNRAYLDQQVLILTMADLQPGELTTAVMINPGETLRAEQIVSACKGMNAAPGELLVYLPEHAHCFLLNRPASTTTLGYISGNSLAGLNQERWKLGSLVEQHPTLVLDPLRSASPDYLSCVCPPEIPLFSDGFESPI